MSYTWTAFPGGYPLAPCLQTLCAEIAASPTYGPSLINDGELGNAAHAAQGRESDHNPWVIGPRGSAYPGQGYVRAIDLGGPSALLLRLKDYLHTLYNAHDPRLWPYGYGKGPDSLIWDWTPNGGVSGEHYNSGDEGHLHLSVSQSNGNNLYSSGWVPALDSRAAWNIDGKKPVGILEGIVGMYSSTGSYESRMASIVKANGNSLSAAAYNLIKQAVARGGSLYVTFPAAKKNPRAIYRVDGGVLVPIDAPTWNALFARYSGAPFVVGVPVTSNLYKLPVAAGVTDPRK